MKSFLIGEWEGTVIYSENHSGCFHDGYVLEYLHIQKRLKDVQICKVSQSRASLIFDIYTVNVNSNVIYSIYMYNN